MKKEIKIGDKTFVINGPDFIDENAASFMNDWAKLIEQQKNNVDVWTEIPAVPGYKFKNLKLEQSPIKTSDEEHEITITLNYDDFIKTEQNGQKT